MKRERELAEKRKNDPPLELARDHPVRKLISRFRKISDNKLSLTSPADIERADIVTTAIGNSQTHINVNATENNTKFINVDESPHQTEAVTKPKESMTKWGRFLAGAPTGDGVKGTDVPEGPVGSGVKSSASLYNKTTGDKISTTPHVGFKSLTKPVKSATKPAAKWGKLFGKSDSIAEKAEEEEELKLMKPPVTSLKASLCKPSTESAKQDIRVSHISEEQPPVTQRDIVCSLSGSSFSVAEKQLISSLYDIKVEIKEEILTLNQKMTRIDNQITEILKMFSPRGSPYTSSNMSSSGSFQTSSTLGSATTGPNNSNSSTANNSVTTSPKRSLPSSPRKYLAEVVASNPDSHSSGSSNGTTSPPGTTGLKKSRKTSARKKVSPIELDIITASKDDDNVPTKDKDLDIL